MDLMTGFDFTKPQDQARAWEYVKEPKPMLVIGSPECTMFSSLQNWNGNEGTTGCNNKLEKAEEHLRFVVQIYKHQIK